jgi:hypothetical protein
MGHDHLLRLGCDARGKGRRNGAERGKKSATRARAWIHVAKASVRRAFCLESRPGVRRLACPGFCAPSTARPVKPAGRDSPRHHEIRWSPRAASSGQHEQSESRSDESTQVSVAPRSCVSPLARGVHRKQCSGAHECVQSTRPEAPQRTVSIRKLRGALRGIPVALSKRVAVRAQKAPLGSSARAERLTASGSESSRGSKGQSDRVVALGVASLTPGSAHSRS